MSLSERTGAWRRLLGLCCLACVVVLWTASSFMASYMLADDTYSKPFFLTYINTAFFTLMLVPFLIRKAISSQKHSYRRIWSRDSEHRDSLSIGEEQAAEEQDEREQSESTHETPTHSMDLQNPSQFKDAADPLTVKETLVLSAKFAVFWFAANWFNSASFSYTSVASSTILTSTSSVFTLIFGALLKVERFTWRKAGGVLASLAGIALIAFLDTRKTAEDDTDRGSFPYMTPAQIIVGDILALTSAMMYGVYATGLTKVVGDETRMNMTLFFGFIGLFATLFLWPLLPILHWTGVEPFSLPRDSKLSLVIVINASISLLADFCWANAVLLTSPLVVTVGLTLTIPLSLVGQIMVNGQYSPPLYWLGALTVVFAFIFINYQTPVAVPPVEPEEHDD